MISEYVEGENEMKRRNSLSVESLSSSNEQKSLRAKERYKKGTYVAIWYCLQPLVAAALQ